MSCVNFSDCVGQIYRSRNMHQKESAYAVKWIVNSIVINLQIFSAPPYLLLRFLGSGNHEFFKMFLVTCFLHAFYKVVT
jgi:hypothetical protein